MALIQDKYQHTLKAEIAFSGLGVHCGKECKIRILPAEVNHGIWFHSENSSLEKAGKFKVCLECALSHQHYRQTILGDKDDFLVATPEHLLSALFAMGVDNADIKINGEELPLLDGGSRDFCEEIERVGLCEQSQNRQVLEIGEIATYNVGNSQFTCHPSDNFIMTYFVDFGESVVGKQCGTFVINAENYVREIAPARTLCFLKDLPEIRLKGLGQGGSLETVIVVDEQKYLNEHLYFPDEVVRHKILDLVGDLSLLGVEIRGHILAEKTGHRENVLFAQYLREKFLIKEIRQ